MFIGRVRHSAGFVWGKGAEHGTQSGLRAAVGAAAAFALAFVLVLGASPGQAVSLQARTQVRDADFLVAGGPSDLLPTSMALGLFNDDSRSDLVVCSASNNTCWLFYGTGAVGGGVALGPPDVIFVGPYGEFGASATFVGDLNGDGFEELAVGAPNGTGVGGVLAGGSLWIFFGRPGEFSGQVGYYDANTTVFGTQAGGRLGFSAAPAGDVDRDGYGDLWVGAPGRSEGASGAGAVFLVPGRASWPTELNDSSAAERLLGAAPGGAFGRVLLGRVDLNNDSRPDLLVGSTKYPDRSGTAVGAAFAFLSPFGLSGETKNTTRANVTFWGNTLVPTLGASLAFAPDFLVEGGRNVFIGAPVYANNTSTGGSVYIYRGMNWACCQQQNTWDAAGLLYTIEAGDQAGSSIAAGGDIDHDGRPDLVVGAPNADVSGAADAGRVYILYGKDVSRQPLLLDNRSEGIEGRANRTLLGNLVVLGDFTGDGWADIVAGAPGDPVRSALGGAAYGFIGRPRNRPPQVAIKVAGNYTEGEFLTLKASLFDPDDDRLTFWWEIPGADPFLNQTTVPVIYPDEGVFEITLTVSDGTLVNRTTIQLVINNSAPECDLALLGEAIEGQPTQVLLNVSDKGFYDTLSMAWQGPYGMLHANLSATYRPTRGGIFTVNVTVTDEDGAAGFCQLVVPITNVAPEVTLIGPSLLYEGDTALFTATVRDPGADDQFGFAWSGPESVGFEPSLVFEAKRPGDYVVSLAVTDLDGGVTFVNTTVRVVDLPPDGTLLPPGTIMEGEGVNLTVKQYTGFSYDPLTVSWFVCLQGYAEGMVYRIPRAPPGEHCVEVLVFDDDGSSSSQSLLLSVANRAPVSSVRPLQSQPYLEGQPLGYEAVVGSWETTPVGSIEFLWYLDGIFQGDGRRIEFTAPFGSHTLRLRATDDDGASTSINISVTVENLPPTVIIQGPEALAPGALGVFHAEARDASGKAVRLMWDVDGVQMSAGADFEWTTKVPGTHIVRVTADDGGGGVSVAQVHVTVTPPASIGAGIDLRWVAIVMGAAAAFAAGLLLGGHIVARIRDRRRED